MNKAIRKIVDLSLFMLFLLFLSGRIGLLLHEFAGHALAWQLLGGTITEFHLFLFGGGRVHYGWTPDTSNLSDLSVLYVHLSGIVTELAVGSALAFFAIFFRTTRLVNAWLAVASSVLLVHGLFYLVTCAYYGSGDGRILFDMFNENGRHGFVILTSCLTVGVAFFVSFTFSPVLRSWVDDYRSKNSFFLIILSIVAAVLLHGTLTVAEQILVKDQVYHEIKTSVNDRLKKDELSERLETYAEEHGREAGQEEVNLIAGELEKKYRQFPIQVPLYLSVLIAFLSGFLLSGNRNDSEPNCIKPKDNWILGSVSAVMVVLIGALNSA